MHGGDRLVEVGAQRLRRALARCGAAACSTTAASTPPSDWRSASAQGVNVLCQAPTEYRMLAKRARLRPLAVAAAAGLRRRAAQPRGDRRLRAGDRPRDPRRLRPDRDRAGDRHAWPGSRSGRARWAGRCPGFEMRRRRRASCSSDAATCPTFFPGYLGGEPLRRGMVADRRPGRAATSDGYLWFEGRDDDVILSAGYRIGPFEVESALRRPPAVAEAAAVAAPDAERGAVVRAVVVLRDGAEPSEELARGAAGARQARDRALQVPAHRRVRRRAAEDRERQDQARRAAGDWADDRQPKSRVGSCRGEPVGSMTIEHARVATAPDRPRPGRVG